jgi:ribosomal protein L11 methyltransferase
MKEMASYPQARPVAMNLPSDDAGHPADARGEPAGAFRPTWTDVRVLVPVGWHELVAESLAPFSVPGTALGRASLGSEAPPEGWEWVRVFLAGERDDPPTRAAVQQVLAELRERTGAAELAGLTAQFVRLAPQDYTRTWRRDFRAFRLGRLVVVPPGWPGRLRAGDLPLELEPGGAFGTGRHATTRACLRELLFRLRPGERVLDAGTGSGILAVAALRLGAGFALGFDVDETALRYARDLAERNRCAQDLAWRVGDVDCVSATDGAFDGLLANLYSDVLIERGAALARGLRAGGWFAVSGFTAARADLVRTALEAAGLTVEREQARGRWRAYGGRKRIPVGGRVNVGQ